MKFLLAAACAAYALLGVHSCAQAFTVVAAETSKVTGVTIALLDDSCAAGAGKIWMAFDSYKRDVAGGCYKRVGGTYQLFEGSTFERFALPVAMFKHRGQRPAPPSSDWQRLNELCRGGSGDDPKTLEACKERDAIK